MLLGSAALFSRCVISYTVNSDSLSGVNVVAGAGDSGECMRVVTLSGFAHFDGDELLSVSQKVNIHNEKKMIRKFPFKLKK
jgi:hypothetical protein